MKVKGSKGKEQMDPPVLKENAASTSVDTLPGTIFKISQPNATSNRSIAFSACSSMFPLLDLPNSTAESMSFWYAGNLAAARLDCVSTSAAYFCDSFVTEGDEQ